jgi:hypothetical protein
MYERKKTPLIYHEKLRVFRKATFKSFPKNFFHCQKPPDNTFFWPLKIRKKEPVKAALRRVHFSLDGFRFCGYTPGGGKREMLLIRLWWFSFIFGLMDVYMKILEAIGHCHAGDCVLL